MKLIKTVFQSTEGAHETLFAIKGLFKKKYYRIDPAGVVELPQYDLRVGVPNETSK